MKTVANTTVAPTWNPAVGHEALSLPKVDGYDVMELVGRGGMGRVYRARQIDLDRTVAIKFLACDAEGAVLARFREEARAIARLQHPNIAQLFETGVADGQPFYTQEFLEGGSLAQSLGGRPLEPRAAASVLELISRAIQHSHENGILHRDLKPANILLAGDGTPKVTDFGLAKNFKVAACGDTPVGSGGGLTKSGDIIGTPAYMPPEQASGVVAETGPAADVYGLGAILYETLTGHPPFQGSDTLQTLLLVLTMDPVSPRTLQPKLPRDLETICLKCLEKKPRNRYASAKDLGDDLKRFLNGEPIVARPVGMLERAGKWARRRKAAAALVGVSILAAILLSVAAIVLTVGFFKLSAALDKEQTANNDLEKSNAQLEQAKTDLENKNTELNAAHEETQRTLELTLASLDRSFFDFSDQLITTPGATLVRRKILDEARALLDILGQQRPNDPVIRQYRANGYYKLGSAENALGRIQQSAEAMERARSLYAALMKELPDRVDYRTSYALSTLMLGNKFLQQGDPAGADTLRHEAFQLSDRLLGDFPDNNEVLKLADEVQFNRYEIAFGQGMRAPFGSALQKEKDAESEAALRKAVEHCRQLVAAAPADLDQKLHLIDRELSLASFLNVTGRQTDAEALILAAKKITIDEAPKDPPLRMRVLAASVWSNLAQLHGSQSNYAQSEREYMNAVGVYETLHRDFPNNPIYQFQAARTLLYAGNAALDDRRAEMARGHYAKAAEILNQLQHDNPGNLQYRDVLKKVDEQLKKANAL